jgi:hypothetical protein
VGWIKYKHYNLYLMMPFKKIPFTKCVPQHKDCDKCQLEKFSKTEGVKNERCIGLLTITTNSDKKTQILAISGGKASNPNPKNLSLKAEEIFKSGMVFSWGNIDKYHNNSNCYGY